MDKSKVPRFYGPQCIASYVENKSEAHQYGVDS